MSLGVWVDAQHDLDLSGSGVPVYKSDRTDAKSVENALVYYLDVLARRQSGEQLVPFQVERLDYRESDRKAFMRGLEVAGQKAVDEFKNAFGG